MVMADIPQPQASRRPLRLLFICSQNRLRSPTAEQVFAGHPGIETASAGTNRGADNPLSAELVEWADVIFVMEKQHQRKLTQGFGAHLFVNLVAMPGPGAFAEKSKGGMRGHTDAVSFPFNGDDDPDDGRIAPSPDFVSLVGLRNPKDVPTRLMLLQDVLPLLSPADVDELKKPQYSIRAQRTFRQGTKRILGTEHFVIDAPVLKDTAGGTYVRYSHSNVTPPVNGGPAEQASNQLEACCNQTAKPVVVQPGDVLIINNRSALHGRGEVGDDVGGQSRWLLRAYALDTSKLQAQKRHQGGAAPHVLFP